MGSVKKGTLAEPYEYWKHLKWKKREFWKRERQAQKAALPERLADDITAEELAADHCTPETPCQFCRRVDSPHAGAIQRQPGAG